MTEGLDTGRLHQDGDPKAAGVGVITLTLHTPTTYALSNAVRAALGLRDGESLPGEWTITRVAERLTDCKIGHDEMKRAFQQFFPHSAEEDHADAIMGAAHSQARHEPPPVHRPYQHGTSRHN